LSLKTPNREGDETIKVLSVVVIAVIVLAYLSLSGRRSR
jgi:hypothetical protein